MSVLIYGCSDYGQLIKNLAKTVGYEIAGFIDDYNTKALGKYEFIRKYYKPSEYTIAMGIGYKNLEQRWKIYEKIKADGFDVVTLIHPKAIVDETAVVGEGVVIMAGAVVDYKAKIDEIAVLWNGVVVSHDSQICENVFLSPNSTVCGFSTVCIDTFVGANAVITDHVEVPDKSFIKAGSVYAGERHNKSN